MSGRHKTSFISLVCKEIALDCMTIHWIGTWEFNSLVCLSRFGETGSSCWIFISPPVIYRYHVISNMLWVFLCSILIWQIERFGKCNLQKKLSYLFKIEKMLFLYTASYSISYLINCRWELPQVEHSVSASTANELRQDRHVPINPEKLKAAAEGFAQSRFYSLCLSRCRKILFIYYPFI